MLHFFTSIAHNISVFLIAENRQIIQKKFYFVRYTLVKTVESDSIKTGVMSLILVCGIPASGKSTIADKLCRLFEADGADVRIIRDGDAAIATLRRDNSATVKQHVSSGEQNKDRVLRQALYQDFKTEKQTRAQLRTNSERALSIPKTVVIVDSLNYIKGFRYELYCVAKTAGATYGVVHSCAPSEVCEARDTERLQRGDDAWGETLLRALCNRFEPPNGRNRWDSPLFPIDTTAHEWESSLSTIVTSLRGGKRLMATMATRPIEPPRADALADIDRVTRTAEAALITHLQAGVAIGDAVKIPGASLSVRLQRKPRIAELRDMRRSFLNYSRVHPPDGQSLVDEYVQYINQQLTVFRQ